MSDPTFSDIDLKIKWLGSELPLKKSNEKKKRTWYEEDLIFVYFYDQKGIFRYFDQRHLYRDWNPMFRLKQNQKSLKIISIG